MFDAHVHVWDTSRMRYGLFADDDELGRPHLIDEYFREAAPLGVRRAICVEAASAGADGHREAEWLIAVGAADARVAGIVAWAPLGSADLGKRLRALKALGGERIVGIRRSFEFEPPAFARRPEVIRGAQLAAELGLVVDLVLFHPSLAATIDLVRACPGTSFVLDHLGKPPIADRRREPWASQLAELAVLPNVAAKLSGLATEAGERWTPAMLAPYVDHAIACFGLDRVMVGSDWPIVRRAGGLGRWIDAVGELLSVLAPSELERVLSGNAARIYGVR
jgi:L-fuconolactonase